MTQLISTIPSAEFSETQFCLQGHSYRTVHSALALAKLGRDASLISDEIQLILFHEETRTVDRERLQVESKRVGVSSLRIEPYRADTDDLPSLLNTFRTLFETPPVLLDLTRCAGTTSILLTGSFLLETDGETSTDASRVFSATACGERQEEHQFEDLTSLIRLPEWQAGVRSFLHNFEHGLLTDHLHGLHDESYKQPHLPESKRLQQLANLLGNTSRNARSALPLETGLFNRVDDPESFWQEVESDVDQLAPFCRDPLPELRSRIEDVQSDANVASKEDLPLDEPELQRQLRVLERLIEASSILPAFLTAREVLVNGAILGTDSDVSGDTWLDGEVRDRHTAPFYLINHWNQHDELRELLSDGQQRVARIWSAVKERRNVLAHAGFTRNEIRLDRLRDGLRRHLQEIRDLVLHHRELLEQLLDFPFERRLLILPFSETDPARLDRLQFALDTRPDVTDVGLLVHKQQESDRQQLREQVTSSGRDLQFHRYALRKDAAGFQGWESIWEQHRYDLLQHRSIYISVSGGTEIMRYTGHQLYEQLSRYGLHLQQIAWDIDSRDTREENESFRTTLLNECWPPSQERSQ